MNLGLKALEADLPEGTPGRHRLRDLQEAVDKIGRAAHDMAVELRPTVLDDLGLRSALELLILRWSDRVGVPADFHFAVPGTGRFLPDIESTLYRIIQEALNNVAKHAGATRVSIIVELRDDEIVAIVDDDGCGFSIETKDHARRLGLSGMRERMAMIGGTLQLESSPGVGTTVRARLNLGGGGGFPKPMTNVADRTG